MEHWWSSGMDSVSHTGLGTYLNLTIEIGTVGTFASCGAFASAGTVYSGTVAAFAAASTTYGTGQATTWTPTTNGQVRVFKFSEAAFRQGIEVHKIDGLPIRIYSAEKTIADAFKFRNKLGMDVVLEALRLWRRRPRRDVENLLQHARHCRVERVVRPYLEALQ